MKCQYPYVAPGRRVFPCGQCLPCRLNRRRIWTHRIMLEAMQHEHSAFVTLTYREPPRGNSLEPEHLSGWLKRLRWRIEPNRIRYFCVGEYGDRSERPHYHAALFGYPSCVGGPHKFERNAEGHVERLCQCPSCLNVRLAWSRGHVMVGNLEMRSAQYIAGYVTKKMTSKEDKRLCGRYPEFARMSLKPGIGAAAIPDVASVILTYKLEAKADVPTVFRLGGSLWPVGRYLRRLLRQHVGLPENAPEEYVEALRSGLLPVFEAADAVIPKGMGHLKNLAVSAAIGAENDQVARNQNAKFLIRGKTI